jgi:hypothetical protein
MLTTDAGGMMSFIRGVAEDKGIGLPNLNTTNTLLQVFDSASGQTISGNISIPYHNELFRLVRKLFITVFEGCLNIKLDDGREISVELNVAIPLLQINESNQFVFIINGKELPFVKLSLNKLLVAVGLPAERGQTSIGPDDVEVIQIRELLEESTSALEILDGDIRLIYMRKLAKLLKYMGDLFQVLSTMIPPIGELRPIMVYTFDRLCFITGLLLKRPLFVDNADTITDYLRTDIETNPKTLYLAFRVKQGNNVMAFNSYATLIDAIQRDILDDTSISIIVRHSRAIEAKLSPSKISQIIDELSDEFSIFERQIGRIDFSGIIGLLSEDGSINKYPNMITIRNLRQAIGKQKEKIKIRQAQALQDKKREHAENKYEQVKKRLDIDKLFVLSNTFLENIGINTSKGNIISLNKLESSDQINLIMDKINSSYESFIDVKKQVKNVVESLSNFKRIPPITDFTITINVPRGRNSRCNISNLFSAIRHYNEVQTPSLEKYIEIQQLGEQVVPQ